MSRIFFLLTWLYASFSVADSIVIQSTTLQEIQILQLSPS